MATGDPMMGLYGGISGYAGLAQQMGQAHQQLSGFQNAQAQGLVPWCYMHDTSLAFCPCSNGVRNPTISLPSTITSGDCITISNGTSGSISITTATDLICGSVSVDAPKTMNKNKKLLLLL